jgi:cytochrome c553
LNAKLPTERPRAVALAALLLAVVVAAGCNPEMRNDSRIRPYQENDFFRDKRASRPLVPGTVARDHLRIDQVRFAGMENGQPVRTFPMPVTKELLERGRERFNIYCAVCHGADGYGRGTAVQRGFPEPPNYHQERLRRAPVGHFYDVITNGYGVMYGYWDRIEPDDRWAIVAYVRALQYSQAVNAADLSPEDQNFVQHPDQYRPPAELPRQGVLEEANEPR